MVLNKLIVGDIYLVDGNVVIGTTFESVEAKEKGTALNSSFFTDQWKNKRLEISGDGYKVEAKILDIKVTSSISDFKNIIFLTDLTSKENIKNNDSVIVLV